MNEQQKNISQYFRNTVAAQVNAKIDFKKTPFEKCDRKTFTQGLLDGSIFRSLLTQEELKRERKKPEKKVREFDVLFGYYHKPGFPFGCFEYEIAYRYNRLFSFDRKSRGGNESECKYLNSPAKQSA